MSLFISIPLIIGIILVLLVAGFRVAIALGIAGLVGLIFILPINSASLLADLSWSAINKFTLTPVPLFILMGEFLVFAKLDETLFNTLIVWIGSKKGSLCHATSLSCAIFAAMSGSSLATTATLGNVAGPEMINRGYSPRATYGAIAAGGTLGILIPPSITMIIYGNLAGVSIGECFIAGIIPGLLCVALFSVLIAVWSYVSPQSMPSFETSYIPLQKKLRQSARIIPVFILITVVLGGIYMGVTTPTEAGALGAFGAFILCMAQKQLTIRNFMDALLSTVKTTSFIMLIIAAASIVSYVIQYLRLPEVLTNCVVGLPLPSYLIIVLFYMLYIFIGMFVDPVSMMVMTVPTILPAVLELGYDPIWFGVVITLTCEIGLITPPVGLNLYILQGVSQYPLEEISKAVMPYLFALLLSLAVLTAFPVLSLWLPGLM